ncbi:MAG: hypothetical protein CMF50_01540 [Legionellales bacterium]|nr:hypothetical protein [Legionellales bacterium]|tara:strand:- start:4141 stop:4440 length:300 start_codon:yes stop_codon:yes gene_type:complete
MADDLTPQDPAASHCRFFSSSCAKTTVKTVAYTLTGLPLLGITLWEGVHGTYTSSALMVMVDLFAIAALVAYEKGNCGFSQSAGLEEEQQLIQPTVNSV